MNTYKNTLTSILIEKLKDWTPLHRFGWEEQHKGTYQEPKVKKRWPICSPRWTETQENNKKT